MLTGELANEPTSQALSDLLRIDDVLVIDSLVPRPSASRARIAYVTFEPLSDSWQKAWYHSYVIYKQSGHGYEATRLQVCFRVYIDTSNMMPTQC